MYRIKEVNNVFIPQKWSWVNLWWVGIPKINASDPDYHWLKAEYQEQYCSYKTIEDARERVRLYKEKNIKPKVKYHKA